MSKHMWMCNSTHKYGESIYSNGWDNIAQHPLLNVIFVCPNGNVFINAIDTTRSVKMHRTYVMHWLDTLKTLEWSTLYKFV